MAGTIASDLSIASTFPFTLVVGALVLSVIVLYWRFVKDKNPDSISDRKRQLKTNEKGSKKEVKKTGGRLVNQKNRQTVFSNPWSLSSLKGHTSPVLDLDLSSNGKYMASCAEDATMKNSTDDDSTCSSTNNNKPSRRQRRNASKKKQQQSDKNEQMPFAKTQTNGFHLKTYRKLGLSNAQLYKLFFDYVVSKKQLKAYGYPVEYLDGAGVAYIETTNGFGDQNGSRFKSKNVVERTCCRCQSKYDTLINGDYLSNDPCVHHWGKLRRSGKENETVSYSCCNGYARSPGCTIGPVHVSLGLTTGYLSGFVKTTPCKKIPTDNDYGVYALDCEMCFTTHGLELVKVSLVRPDGSVVYNELVKPSHVVIDCNTRFSGITHKLLQKATKSLADIQKELLRFVHDETILIGHSLENDLRALKMVHSTVVDTSIVFPHFHGFPFRRSLKSLVNSVLKRDIQKDVHNSVEDARASLELMLWRLRKDLVK